MQSLFERSPASIPLCAVILYLVVEEIFYDNEKTSATGTDNAYPLVGFLWLHRP